MVRNIIWRTSQLTFSHMINNARALLRLYIKSHVSEITTSNLIRVT